MKYYLYRHIRPDLNVPFYVGIGTKLSNHPNGVRSEYKRAFMASKCKGARTKHWFHVYEKCNKNIVVEILYETNDIKEIKNKETEFILLYGRLDKGSGSLINLTNGGEGAHGAVVPAERRAKISKSLKGRIVSNETRLKLKRAGLGHSVTPATREKIKANRNYRHTDEARQKIRNALIGRSLSEETKHKIAQSNKGIIKNVGRIVSEETRLKMSISAKNRKKKP